MPSEVRRVEGEQTTQEKTQKPQGREKPRGYCLGATTRHTKTVPSPLNRDWRLRRGKTLVIFERDEARSAILTRAPAVKTSQFGEISASRGKQEIFDV